MLPVNKETATNHQAKKQNNGNNNQLSSIVSITYFGSVILHWCAATAS